MLICEAHQASTRIDLCFIINKLFRQVCFYYLVMCVVQTVSHKRSSGKWRWHLCQQQASTLPSSYRIKSQAMTHNPLFVYIRVFSLLYSTPNAILHLKIICYLLATPSLSSAHPRNLNIKLHNTHSAWCIIYICVPIFCFFFCCWIAASRFCFRYQVTFALVSHLMAAFTYTNYFIRRAKFIYI